MEKKNRRLVMLLLWPLLAVLFMTACGEKEEKSYVYVAEKIPLPCESNEKEGFKARDGYLYYYEGNKAYRFSIAELAENKNTLPEREEIFSGNDGDGIISAYTVDQDGCGYYVLSAVAWQTGEVQSFVLVKQQADGAEEYRLDLKELNIDGISSLAADGSGRAFLWTGELLCVVDAEGKLIARIPGSRLGVEYYGFDSQLLEGEDGSIYFYQYIHTNIVYEISGSNEDFRSEAVQTKRIAFPCITGICYSAPQGLLCAGKDDLLYRYLREESRWETVLCYGDSSLVMQPYQMLQLSEEWMAAYYYDSMKEGSARYEFYFLTKTDAALLPERGEKELVLAAGGLTEELEQFIAEYNRTSGYHITVKYYQGADRVTRLSAAMVSSNPPDLVDLDQEMALTFSGKGMLEDLAPYLEASDVLDREDFLENLLDGYTLGGRLVSIPNAFDIDVTVGRASQVGTEAGWTAEDVQALAAAHPDDELFKNPTFSSMVVLFTEEILGRFIDWESGECSFDGEEFASLVRWMEEHSDGFGDSAPYFLVYYWGNTRFSEEELIGPQYPVSSIMALLPCELYFGEKITAIGDPTPDGRPYYRGRASNTVAIAANSKNKEAAWRFLEAFLSWESYSILSGIPSRRDLLDKKVNNMLTIEYETGENGDILVYQAGEHKGEPVMKAKVRFMFEEEVYPCYYMTQEQVDMVTGVIEQADFTPVIKGRQYQIISILLEELGAYIDGQKSLEEAADILQNRVQNLVQENM